MGLGPGYLYLDYETRGIEDLKATGARRYALTAQPILAAWCFSTEPNPMPPDHFGVSQWDFFSGDPFPQELLDALTDPRIIKSAFNAPFEMAISEHCLGLPIDVSQWRCTRAWAYSRAFTGTLSDVGKALGLPLNLIKNPNGPRLITRFCKPRKLTKKIPRYFFEPEDDDAKQWEEFRFYNRQDVIAEIAIAHRLSPYPWTEEELDLWQWDQEINARGIPIDMDFAQKASELIEEQSERYLDEIAYITDLKNPNSRDQVLLWLRAQGLEIEDMQQETLERILHEEPPF